MANRPFKKGDLLILNDTTQCELMSFAIQQHTISPEFRAGDTTLNVKIASGNEYGMYFVNGNNVKTIRTPRKGSKEARDIVAMLGKQARIAKNLQARELGWKFLKEVYRNGGIKNYGVVIFESAKSMLK